ncbi:peptide chain release factor 1 [bacterium BMS3Abin01]|nr:peptide chain release factor 1 [bacterium BMS3Abin01]
MLSREVVSSLQDFSNDRDMPVVSLYLDIDGARYPSRVQYETELNVMLKNARKPGYVPMELTREQTNSLDGELDAIGQYISMDFRRSGARGLALFSCQTAGLWRVIPLAVPVENRLLIDRQPRIAPLSEIIDRHGHICVLITNKETARIFQVFAGSITEYTEILDSVPQHHDQGGWEQAKLQRWHELEVREHLKRASDATLDIFKQENFHRLMVGIADELWPELERVLHPYLRERLAERFSIDINASADDILKKVSALDQERIQREEQELLDSLGPEMTAGKNFVGGLDDTLAVLNQRRADMLIVESGYAEPGRRCHACHTLSFSEETCPSCDMDATLSPDIVDDARETAIRQGATVKTVEPGHPAMQQAGRIAARLRY